MEKIKNKVAITGASGFIGRHLLEDIEPSQFDLYLITRNKGKKLHNIPANAIVVEADLSDYESMNKAFAGIDVIIDIAAEVRNIGSWKRQIFQELNVGNAVGLNIFINKIASVLGKKANKKRIRNF
ncbi:MAG: SDR family oxidoreductase [Bacteroidia bacterium]